MQYVATLGEFTPRDALIWRNLNSFAARCLGANVAGPYSDATYAMRSALEEDLSTIETSMVRCKVQVACDWISHAAKPFLWWARENINYYVTPDDQRDNTSKAALCIMGHPRCAYSAGRSDRVDSKRLARKI
jgi:hypothetical protein